jgi:hypothetical protein
MEVVSTVEAAVHQLSAQAGRLTVLSTRHLTPESRAKLKADDLSVNAYPASSIGGGFVFVGDPRHRIPDEPDLAWLFELAERAKVGWLMFDPEGPLFDELPVFEPDTPFG